MLFRPFRATAHHASRHTRLPKGRRILWERLQPRPRTRAFWGSPDEPMEHQVLRTPYPDFAEVRKRLDPWRQRRPDSPTDSGKVLGQSRDPLPDVTTLRTACAPSVNDDAQKKRCRIKSPPVRMRSPDETSRNAPPRVLEALAIWRRLSSATPALSRPTLPFEKLSTPSFPACLPKGNAEKERRKHPPILSTPLAHSGALSTGTSRGRISPEGGST